jgi:hypothetical protein
MDADLLQLSLTLKSPKPNGIQGCYTCMVKALASTKTLIKAKYEFGAFTTVETTNAISPVITSISLPQGVY